MPDTLLERQMSKANERQQAANPADDRRQRENGPAQPDVGSADVEIDGARLRESRKLMGDDLKSFAARAGITFQYVSQLELGVRRRVSPPTFVRICDALGIEDRRQLVMRKRTP